MELFRTAVNVEASVSNIDCRDIDWRLCDGIEEFLDWRYCVCDCLVREEMDKVLPSGFLGEEGSSDLIRVADSIDDDVCPPLDVPGINFVNDDDGWWLGDDNDIDGLLFVAGEILISHKSSSGIEERRELSFSIVELHTW